MFWFKLFAWLVFVIIVAGTAAVFANTVFAGSHGHHVSVVAVRAHLHYMWSVGSNNANVELASTNLDCGLHAMRLQHHSWATHHWLTHHWLLHAWLTVHGLLHAGLSVHGLLHVGLSVHRLLHAGLRLAHHWLAAHRLLHSGLAHHWLLLARLWISSRLHYKFDFIID